MLKYFEIDTSLKDHGELIKKLIPMKFKDILLETLEENSRKGNYIRIYPSKGSENYDRYFSGARPYNKFLHKCLYSNEIIPLSLKAEMIYKPVPEGIEEEVAG